MPQAELWSLNATRIQSMYRMHRTRKGYLDHLDRNERAVQIQSAWKGFLCFRKTRLFTRKVCILPLVPPASLPAAPALRSAVAFATRESGVFVLPSVTQPSSATLASWVA
jgi:hypothetical protein